MYENFERRNSSACELDMTGLVNGASLGFWVQAALTAALGLLLVVVVRLWLRTMRIRAHFSRQGISGPPPQVLVGNVKEMFELTVMASREPLAPGCHNIVPRVIPFIHQWGRIYGSTFLTWFGPNPRLIVSDLSLIHEIFDRAAGPFDKYEAHPLVKTLEGNGLLTIEGKQWAQRRKLISPIFYMENLKRMMPIMAKSVASMIEEWSSICESGEAEIDISECLGNLVEDVVIRTIFGGSYEDGKAICRLQSQETVLASEQFRKIFIPGYRYLPTRNNVKIWMLSRQIEKLLPRLIQKKRANLKVMNPINSGHRDLLEHLIMDSLKEEGVIREEDIVEECKSFFFAGKNTSSTMLIWVMLLLAMHPRWQHLAREEIFRVCGARDSPTKEDISNLETLGMIIYEALRLYPPAIATVRRTDNDAKLGSLKIPPKTEILVPILAIHHDVDKWGPDAHEFNPSRFAQGVARAAKYPSAYMPFGLGARQCIGQNLAVLQAKLAMAMILQRFSFKISPNYKHSPKIFMFMRPEFGAPVVFQRL